LPEDAIDAVGSGRTDVLNEPYALLRDILALTLAWKPVPGDLQRRAVAAFGKEGLVEIVVLSGFYQMFAAINQGFDIKP
jgi:4-carboxymuconolactone decarboxylase